MSSVVLHSDVRIPADAHTQDGFRRWAKSDDFPECGRFSFLDGDVWVDLTPEQLFTHNDVKFEFAGVIRSLLKSSRKGRFFGDGTLVTNISAGVSTEPDGTIVRFESLEAGAVRLVEAVGEGFIEIAGTPDVVLEIVSTSSLRNDTVVLRRLYWQAEIPEYWLVDVRGDELQFDILKRGPENYSATHKKDGWVKSSVLGTSFRLTRQADAAGNPEYTLEFQ